MTKPCINVKDEGYNVEWSTELKAWFLLHVLMRELDITYEDQAHAPNEKTWKDELVKCAAMYALIPITYINNYINE